MLSLHLMIFGMVIKIISAVWMLIYVPVLLSYAVVYEDSVDLYVDERKLSDEIKKHLADHNVHIKPYNDIYEEVKQFSGNDVVLVDPECLNYAVFNNNSKRDNTS